MDLFRKAFLMIVGAAAITVEEATKSVKEVNHSLEERRDKIMKAVKPSEPPAKVEA
jgi:hypothetical protein